MDERIVLDSSALLALLGDEPGADRVAAALPQSVMSVVNVAEVLIVLARNGLAADEADDLVGQLALQTAPADALIARVAAAIAAPSRTHPLALGDRFCLATAHALELPVLTADRAWLKLDLGVTIRSIR